MPSKEGISIQRKNDFLDCLNSQKILIIDDEVPILKLLSNILTRQGHTVDTAENGKDGVQKILANAYNLIITDIIMPGKSGCHVLDEVRKAKGRSLPVVGMSGTPWLIDDNLFDAVLTKPFTREQLFEVIKNVAVSF
ncbi:MAG: response regulator [Desulfobacterales bacterium]|nr:response regulator [Desulfobacterales bacterium]